MSLTPSSSWKLQKSSVLHSSWTRTNQEQLGSGYVSETKMKFLPESCSSKCVAILAAKKWEREISWNLTWAKIQWKPEQEFMRGSESERVSMRASHPLLGLYLKTSCNMHARRGQSQWSRSHWRRWGPGAIGPGSAGSRVAPLVPPLARFLCNDHIFKFWCMFRSWLEKMFKIIFQRTLKLRKYFWYFCKKKKVLEKF